MSDPKLTKISGIGTATAEALAGNGFTTIEGVAAATENQLSEVRGFGPARAATVIAAAKALLETDEAPKAGKGKKKDKKKTKKNKKGKGKKKDGKKKKDKKKKDKKKRRK